MENKFVNGPKDGQVKEDMLNSLGEDGESAQGNDLDFSESKSKRLARKGRSEQAVILNVKKLQSRGSVKVESFTHGLNNRMPKHIMSLDERYLRRCLELIHISASKAAPCNISLNLSSLKMGIFSDTLNLPKFRGRNTCDMSKLVIECPVATGTGDVVVSPAGQWVVGTLMGSKSMMKILKSPLFRQFGALEDDVKFGGTSLIDAKGAMCTDFISSPGGLSIRSPQNLPKGNISQGNHRYGPEAVHKRFISTSSTNSTCSDQSPSSGFATVSQGMLQCTWKGGIPHFVFSVDDQREVYVANQWKAELPDDKALDCMYLFHSRTGGQKEHKIPDNKADLVGKMKVSSSFTLCPNDSKIMETEFVFFGGRENYASKMQTSSSIIRKNKGLSKKVVEVFRTSHSSKQRTTSKFGGMNATLENDSWEQCQDTCNNPSALGRTNLLENDLPPNLELAAIVVKDHLPGKRQEAEVGGWGLKFLKKVGLKQNSAYLEASLPSECCLRSTGDCSTSMDILVPAGIHGGPRTRNGGPSSLIERWRSGGHCDCGGWDIGCPLTVLKTRATKEEFSHHTDIQEEYKSFDLFAQGSELSAPILRVVNVHDGLYFIHFRSMLSALQSFSIAVAIIHTRSPILRPKTV